MCQLKSCLVLKNRVFCSDYDSHQQMLKELGIEDSYLHASKTFVRVELTPPDGVKSLMEPLDKWTLKVDQDVTPEWWDEKADRQRVEEAIEAWRSEHVFTEGEHIVKAGKVYAYDSATVTAYGGAAVEARGNAKVEAFGNATVKASNIVTVMACNNTKVEAYNNVTVEAYDNAEVLAYDSTRVEAWGDAAVKAYNDAIAIYPRQRKAIYPAGWIVETHK